MTPPIRTDSTTKLTVVCLGAAVALIAALGYEAVTAARAQRETVESVLRDYAELAADQYAGSVSMALEYEWFYPVLRVLSADADGVRAPGAEEPIDTQESRRRLGDLTSGLFLVELESGTVVRPTNWPPGDVDHILREAARRYALVATDRGWPVAMEIVGTGETRMLVVLRALGQGNPSSVAGFTAPLSTLGGVLGPALEAERILPRSFAKEAPVDELVAVRISTPDGDPLYESGPAFDATFAAATALGPRLAELTLETAIPPDAAPRLVIGGLPRSRLPTVAAMLTVAISLLGASMLLSRRERELVSLREQFVAGASHELRTPLAQIRMFAETLRLDRVRSTDERQRSVEILDREARRLSYLVENLLQFSRNRRSQPSTAIERVDLDTLSLEVIDGFRPLAAARGATLALESHEPAIARADRDMVRQVLLNLLDNATKYGPAGQQVTVSTRPTDPSSAILTVDDEGPGVDAAHRPLVWARFWRGPDTGNTTGTGIGLALVKELVALNDGDVAVSRSPAGGARFSITLPGVSGVL